MYDLSLLAIQSWIMFMDNQDNVCNVCHDLTMLSVSISDITIITFKNVDYRCIIYNI